MIKALFRLAKETYLDLLYAHAKGQIREENNWFVISAFNEQLDVLEFNLKLLHVNEGKLYLNSNKFLYFLLDYSIRHNKYELFLSLKKYLETKGRRMCHGGKTPLEMAIKHC